MYISVSDITKMDQNSQFFDSVSRNQMEENCIATNYG